VGLLADHPLVTLIGAGGCGKSRLALEVALACADGLITNDKFCFTHRRQLTLSWSRRPLRLREQVTATDLQNQ
jgi:predicted ATPase